jgi:alpha-2-macroglobulin
MKALCRVLAILALLAGLDAAAPLGAQTRFWFASGGGTFRPEAPVRVGVYASYESDVEAALVPLSVAEVVGIVNRAYAAVPAALVQDRRAIATVRTHIAAGSQKDGNHQVDFGRQRPGFYAFRLRQGGEFAGARLLSVTSVGIVTADTGGSLTAYALDLRTMRARHDVTFDRYASSGERRDSLRADPDGLAVFGELNGTDVVFARGDDGALTFAHAPYTIGQAIEQHAGYIQTDRPIYRPGDRVHYRALVRDGVPGSYTVPAGEVTLTIRDPEWKDVSTTKVRLDAFGAFAADLPLADDAKLGIYQIAVNNVATAFAVEAYKKPEYVIDVAAPRYVVSGDPGRFGVAARYFFGRPAAGMRLHYRATFADANAWWRRGSPFRFSGYQDPVSTAAPPVVEGDLVADVAGRATIVVPTRAVDNEKLLNVEVDARDATGRTVTAATSTTLTPASFYLTVVPQRWFVRAGESLDLDLSSIAYDTRKARPGTPVAVSFARRWYETGEQRREELFADAASVTTDANGHATVHWKPTGSGSFTVTATSRDERGRDVSTVSWIWVADERYSRAYTFDGVTVIPQKSGYAPGERGSVLVTAPQGDVDALVRVTGGARDRIFVRHLASQATTLEIEPPSDLPHYRVSVLVPTLHGTSTGYAELTVVPAPHLLHVTIAPQKAKFLPGETARFAIRVEDGAGRGVPAQIGLGVVDDAIFALRRSAAFDPFAAFYATSGPYRGATWSWTSLDDMSSYVDTPLKMIGSVQSRAASGAFVPSLTVDMYNVGAAAQAPSFEGLRSDFRDTAYWAPAVTTGQDGRATVAFRWPDSLTSYTASGIAATQGADFGQGAGAALVTKDFLVRLGAPRFLRRGDAARITAVAQGTPRAKTARLRFSAPALGVTDVTTTARFDRNASANAHWNVRGGELGNRLLRLAGTSGALADGMQVAVPVESALSAEHLRAAGKLPAEASLALVLPRGGDAGPLRIDLAPSALAQLIADVRLLQVYPYYCVEQTMSAALPAVFVDRLRKRITLPPAEGPEPAQVAKRAVDRLVKLQHADGSWGWWEHDAANPFMTAYALYGLAELAREGYDVPPVTLSRGIDNLSRQIAASGDTLAFWGGAQPGSEWNTRAFMLYALADAKPAAVDRKVLAAADAHAKGMNPYALAVLGLAHVELADRAGAQPILSELLGRVTDDGTSAHWKGAAWHYRWMDDPIETTAYALRFVHAMTPADPRVAHAVNWLRAQQHGSWFETTKDTAAAIYAMVEAESVTSDELHPHETIRVTLDGREIKRVRIDAPVLPRDQRSIVLAPEAVRHGGTLRFEREGTGALAWSTDWTQFVPTPSAAAGQAPFRISRTYSAQRGNDWRIGDQVDVDVTVVATGDTQYVAIEDPMPAGLEYQPRQHESGDDWTGLQFFDDRVLFFADRMWKEHPLHFHYTLRATTVGTFAAPAPSAYAMYGPPNTSSGLSATVTIR